MTTTQMPPAQKPAAPAPKQAHRKWLVALARRLHFYAAILIGPFILVSAITGTLYAIGPNLDRLAYADQVYADSTATNYTLAEQIDAAVAYRGYDENPTGVRPAPAPGENTRVLFNDDSVPDGYQLAVFVDPSTGEVAGTLPSYSTNNNLPISAFLSKFHTNLGLGPIGNLYSEVAASWMWVIVLAGLVLWWFSPRRKRRKNDGVAASPSAARVGSGAAKVPSPETGVGMQRKGRWTRKWFARKHMMVGLAVSVVALGLSATGLTWSTFAGDNISQLRQGASWVAPKLNSVQPGSDAQEVAPNPHAEHGASMATGKTAAPFPGAVYQSVLDVARANGIKADKLEIKPGAPGETFTVVEQGRTWPAQADSIAIDAFSGQVVDYVSFDRDYPFGAKLSRWGIDAHMGNLFGWVNQWVLILTGIGLTGMVIMGYIMWIKRRPTRGTAWVGTPFPRGALRQAPKPLVVIGGLLLVGLGIFLPVFGVTLAAFLLVDVIVAAVKRNRMKGTFVNS